MSAATHDLGLLLGPLHAADDVIYPEDQARGLHPAITNTRIRQWTHNCMLALYLEAVRRSCVSRPTHLNGGLDGLDLDGKRLPDAILLHVHQLARLAVDAPRALVAGRVLGLSHVHRSFISQRAPLFAL